LRRCQESRSVVLHRIHGSRAAVNCHSPRPLRRKALAESKRAGNSRTSIFGDEGIARTVTTDDVRKTPKRVLGTRYRRVLVVRFAESSRPVVGVASLGTQAGPAGRRRDRVRPSVEAAPNRHAGDGDITVDHARGLGERKRRNVSVLTGG
jgi:hypothetical protein